MSLEVIGEFVIGEHWLPAIINGDYTGLTGEEEEQLNSFLDDYSGTWNIEDEEPFFGIDEISGLKTMVYNVFLYSWVKDGEYDNE